MIPIGAFKKKIINKSKDEATVTNQNFNNYNNNQIEKNMFSSFLLSIYDDEDNKFISLCLCENGINSISNETYENIAKNLIAFYPKNYEIPIYIKPDFLFKPLEIWEIEFEEIVDSDLFLTNHELNYYNIIENKFDVFDFNSDIYKKENNEDFYIGKTLNSVIFSGKKRNLNINEVTTLKNFKKIFTEYYREKIQNDIYT